MKFPIILENLINKQMRKEHKLVALCAVLPVLADWIEDLNDQTVFKRDLKRKANMLMQEIRKVDNQVLQVYGENREQIYEQQVELQIRFRQFVESIIVE
jgi:hypothetical protein